MTGISQKRIWPRQNKWYWQKFQKHFAVQLCKYLKTQKTFCEAKLWELGSRVPPLFPALPRLSVSFWSGFVVFKYNKAKIQSFSSLKDGSRLFLAEKDIETLGLVSVSPEILSQVKSRSRLVHKKLRQCCLGLISYKKLALTISRSRSRSKFL